MLEDAFPQHGTVPGSVGIGHSGWYADLVEVTRFFDRVQPTCVLECRYTNTLSRPPRPHGPVFFDSVWVSLLLSF